MRNMELLIMITGWQWLTVGVIALLAAAAIAYDYFVWRVTRGDAKTDATISKLILRASSNPIVGVIIGMGLGVLFGHLFWPQHVLEACK